MKKTGTLNRLALAGVLLAMSGSLAVAAPQSGKAEVTALRGTAQIGNVAAKVGDVATQGSVITTGSRSLLDLYLGANGPTLQVQENTSLTLSELTADEAGPEPVANTKISLTQGRVSGYVKKSSAASTYVVETPTTTAAIRGTTYLVSAEGFVWVWDGCVEITFRNPSSRALQNFTVCAGQMFDPNIPGIVKNELPFPPVLVPSSRQAVGPQGPIVNLSPVKPAGGSGGEAPPVIED